MSNYTEEMIIKAMCSGRGFGCLYDLFTGRSEGGGSRYGRACAQCMLDGPGNHRGLCKGLREGNSYCTMGNYVWLSIMEGKLISTCML